MTHTIDASSCSKTREILNVSKPYFGRWALLEIMVGPAGLEPATRPL